MLDIYLIADGDASWIEPEESCYIDSFSLEEWMALSGLWLMLNGESISLSAEAFFEDTRVMSGGASTLLNQVIKFIQFNLPSDPFDRRISEKASRKFRKVLKKSVIQGKGIIAFCD